MQPQALWADGWTSGGISTALLEKSEDAESQAQEAFDIARSCCGSCRAYHGIWPYLRLTGRKRGVDADREVLVPLLARMIAGGARRILLAGSADPGVLSLVLDAGGAHQPLAITVVDLCATPLATCRSFAARRGFAIQTQQGCLSEMTFDADYDVVVAHSVLSFIAPSLLPAVGEAVGRALVPGGRLVVTTSLSPTKPGLDEGTFCDDVLAKLRARGIGLPTGVGEFRELLTTYAQGRRHRGSPFASVDELTTFLGARALRIERLISKARGTGFKAGGAVVERSNPGVVLVAMRDWQAAAGGRP